MWNAKFVSKFHEWMSQIRSYEAFTNENDKNIEMKMKMKKGTDIDDWPLGMSFRITDILTGAYAK